MNSPSEYLKIKYSAPPEACKCGDCQLVPASVLRGWVDRFEQLEDRLGGKWVPWDERLTDNETGGLTRDERGEK